MKRISRDLEKFAARDLFASFVRKYDLSLNFPKSVQQFLDNISSSLNRNKADLIILHGRRIGAMFGYVAASLGRCKASKQEDPTNSIPLMQSCSNLIEFWPWTNRGT